MYRLSRRAQANFEQIITSIAESEKYGGPVAARRVADALDTTMLAIADGRIPGHRNDQYKTKRPLLFVTARPTNYVIAFEPTTREIAGIAYGGMDPTTIFADA